MQRHSDKISQHVQNCNNPLGGKMDDKGKTR
jgi:hypothetical protein